MTTQADYWNSDAGRTWVAEADRLGPMLAPLGALAQSALGDVAGKRVLDIGCGAGASARQLAAAGAWVTGVDVSAPLLDAARQKTGGPEYLLADAGVDDLRGPYDAAFSRFGVMFFEDPPAAFSHLRAAMKPGAPMAFVCWGPMLENVWAMKPVQAVLPFLPAPPEPPTPGAPGPFAFADPARPRALLENAGWSDVTVKSWRGDYLVGPSAAEALPLMLRVGPLGRLLREHPTVAAPAEAALLDLLKTHETPEGVAMGASVWIVTARA
jgi:SAM-dependent methyltransferase